MLAIDYGTERIGLAVSYATLADPLTIIANDEKAVAYICKVIDDYRVSHIIVGLSENQMAVATQRFAQSLRRYTSVPIELFDETLSTKTVRSKLAAARKSQRQRVDHLAAAEFLQEWLDTR